MKNRTMRRIKQDRRNRLIRAKIVAPHNDSAQERKKVERAWAEHLNLNTQGASNDPSLPPGTIHAGNETTTSN